ncbi:MAG: hypothetical protein KC635_02605 [Myxococcales bacterium]|nr:hypothetical protein [Myxococcales bacterium]MCB9731048.1 hypothetical protein [Deltaproteobacteria bacterium]
MRVIRMAWVGLALVLGAVAPACGTAGSAATTEGGGGAGAAEVAKPASGAITVETRSWPLHSEEYDQTITLPVVAGGLPADVQAKVNAMLSPEALLRSPIEEIQKEYAGCTCGTVGAGLGDVFQRPPVLSIPVWVETMAAYPDGYVVTAVFDTETGERVGVDAFFEPSHQAELVAAVEATLRPLLDAAKKSAEEQGYGDVGEMLDEARFQQQDLGGFMPTEEGVAFEWSAGLPHVVAALEPEGPLVVPWAQARPYLTARYQKLADGK